MTSGPATPRWPICKSCRWTSSRSTVRSFRAFVPKAARRCSWTSSSPWPMASGCRSSPKASKARCSSSTCENAAATSARAFSSASRCRQPISPPASSSARVPSASPLLGAREAQHTSARAVAPQDRGTGPRYGRATFLTTSHPRSQDRIEHALDQWMVDGLHHMSVEACLAAFRAMPIGAVRRHRHQPHALAVALTKQPGEVVAIDAGHPEVQEYELCLEGGRGVHRFGRIGNEGGRATHELKQPRKALRGVGLVVDHEYAYALAAPRHGRRP